MTESISWTLNVAVAGGPKLSGSSSLEVGAYDKVRVVVEAGSQAEVEVQPGDEGQVQFLLIRSDQYGSDLTYRVNDESGAAIALDALQLFIGAGAVSLLDQPPKTFYFDNQMDGDAAIEILAGRKATTGETETDDTSGDSGSTDTPAGTDSAGSPADSTGGTETLPGPTGSTGAQPGGTGS